MRGGAAIVGQNAVADALEERLGQGTSGGWVRWVGDGRGKGKGRGLGWAPRVSFDSRIRGSCGRTSAPPSSISSGFIPLPWMTMRPNSLAAPPTPCYRWIRGGKVRREVSVSQIGTGKEAAFRAGRLGIAWGPALLASRHAGRGRGGTHLGHILDPADQP